MGQGLAGGVVLGRGIDSHDLKWVVEQDKERHIKHIVRPGTFQFCSNMSKGVLTIAFFVIEKAGNEEENRQVVSINIDNSMGETVSHDDG